MISAKITKGHTISAYYSIEDDVNNSGATYSENRALFLKILSRALIMTIWPFG